MSNELEALIHSLEALHEPRRELDCRIGVLTGRFHERPEKYEGAGVRYIRIDEDGTEHWPGNAPDMMVPEYTGSIDAAKRLVADGWRLRLYETPFEDQATWECTLFEREAAFGRGRQVVGWAEMAAVAVCVAALRTLLPRERRK